MLLAIYNRSLIINVDESSYNRIVKSNYSWLPIGDSNPILNTNWTGRTTIIFGLISNGHWICMSINKTTNTKHFWIFILLLSRFIKDLWENQTSIPKIVFNNASIHLTAETKRVWNYLGFEINTIPAYSPQLAPVELVFGISKRRIQKQIGQQKINFGNPGGKKVVMESLNTLDVTICNKIWSKFIKISKNLIITARKSAKLENYLQSDHLHGDDRNEIDTVNQDFERRSKETDNSDQELL